MKTKTCKRCKKTLAVSLFSKNCRKPDGLQISCKACMKEMNARHYTKYKDVQQALNRKNKALLRVRLREIKEKNPCLCGEDCVACLDFHHLSGKEDTISRMLSNTYGWDRLVLELRKCCVICSNCHRKLHAKARLPFDVSELKPLAG